MLWVATPTVLCMCCRVPEGVLLGASTDSRGNHPDLKPPCLCFLSPVCPTPWAPAVLSCRVRGSLRATASPGRHRSSVLVLAT